MGGTTGATALSHAEQVGMDGLVGDGPLRRKLETSIAKWLLLLASVIAASTVLLLIVFVVGQAIPLIQHSGFSWLWGMDWDVALQEAFSEEIWVFGVLPLIVGTLLTTTGAVIMAGVIGMGASVFLAELGPKRIRRPVETLVRLLAGVPSVVFGLIGLTVVVPWVQRTFISDELLLKYSDIPLDGSGLGVAIIVLTFMILPFFVTVATDSLRAVPQRYREGGLAIGLSPWRTVTRIVIPAATPGVTAGLVLAAARAIGEAIAISMVGGALAFIPKISDGPVMLLSPLRTMAAAIVENGETMNVAPIQSVLFALAAVLLLSSLSLSLLARVVFARLQRRMGVLSDREI